MYCQRLETPKVPTQTHFPIFPASIRRSMSLAGVTV